MHHIVVQVSISSTFYTCVFHTKAHFWCQNFIRKLYFGFEIFGTRITYENCARKTLMKLTTGVARIFWSRANFEIFFACRAALFRKTDFKIIMSLKQENLFLLKSYEEKCVQFLPKCVLVCVMCCFSTKVKKVQGPQKRVGGPHFDHVWYSKSAPVNKIYMYHELKSN